MGKHQTRDECPKRKTARALGLLAMLLLGCASFAPTAAQAREVELSAGRMSAVVKISIGKSESVRTEGAISEVIVSDPDIADAIPLSDRSLSILG
jgi:pilus assembly protein CpaC